MDRDVFIGPSADDSSKYNSVAAMFAVLKGRKVQTNEIHK